MKNIKGFIKMKIQQRRMRQLYKLLKKFKNDKLLSWYPWFLIRQMELEKE